jgi:hypothetical protein
MQGYYHQHLVPIHIDHQAAALAAELVRRLGWSISAYCVRVRSVPHGYSVSAPGYLPRFVPSTQS